jgi:hypothetical protein
MDDQTHFAALRSALASLQRWVESPGTPLHTPVLHFPHLREEVRRLSALEEPARLALDILFPARAALQPEERPNDLEGYALSVERQRLEPTLRRVEELTQAARACLATHRVRELMLRDERNVRLELGAHRLVFLVHGGMALEGRGFLLFEFSRPEALAYREPYVLLEPAFPNLLLVALDEGRWCRVHSSPTPDFSYRGRASLSAEGVQFDAPAYRAFPSFELHATPTFRPYARLGLWPLDAVWRPVPAVHWRRAPEGGPISSAP